MLDKIIAEKRRHLAKLKKAFDQASKEFHDAQLELSALERAASVRPALRAAANTANAKVQEPVSSKRGGRQYGSVNNKWRCVLAQWVQSGNAPLSEERIHQMVRPDLGLALTSVRQRVRHFSEQGYLEITSEGYRVANMAIEKFSLMALSQPSNADPRRDVVRH